MERENLSCCFTGYRPQKFPFVVSAGDTQYVEFENTLFSVLGELVANGTSTFISGMAMGFDIIAAEAVLYLRELSVISGVKLICVIPFIEQSNSFPPEWKARYDKVLSECDEAILISDKYYPSCYMKRNFYMVDNSDFVLTFFDGKSGGTAKTVEYAEKKGRKVINLYK